MQTNEGGGAADAGFDFPTVPEVGGASARPVRFIHTLGQRSDLVLYFVNANEVRSQDVVKKDRNESLGIW